MIMGPTRALCNTFKHVKGIVNWKVLARYLVENLSSHNIWAFKMLITESIYFLNVFGNIYLMDVFLGGEFRTYGIQVSASV